MSGIGPGEILAYYEMLKKTIEGLKRVESIVVDHSINTEELISSIESSEIRYGEEVEVRGVYSDFVPLARDLVFDVQGYQRGLILDPLASKPFPIDNHICSTIQTETSKYAGNSESIPIFYEPSTDRPINKYMSGKKVIIEGELVSIPQKWDILLDIDTVAGINVTSIDIIEESDKSIGVLPWKIVETEKDIEFEEGSGMIYDAGGLWDGTFRIDQNRVLCVSGHGTKSRHGKLDETAENIKEFHLMDAGNEEKVEKMIEFHSKKFEKGTVEASWDMSRNGERIQEIIERNK
ncbi:MAG: hypothetical protein U5J64_02735 [Halobacteriales archaeon]|nr:hypothetical protein [Halobacteriales archaeon]